MIDVIMHGCNGRIGQTITGIIKDDPDMRIIAGVDRVDYGKNEYPVYENIESCELKADVIIDFSSAGAIDGLIEYADANRIPMVLCTTGLSDEQLGKIDSASKRIPILRSANMSLGVNLLLKLVKEAVKALEPAGFDIEIVEKHHKHKLDAPSGTALALADAANEALSDEYEYVFDRSGRRQERPKAEIGISAVRGGSIVGDHDVIFAGTDEVITLSHTAYSRSVFAKGAIEAARFLAGKRPGLYSMSDVIG